MDWWCPPFCLSICLSVHLSVYSSVCPSVCLSTCLYIHLSVCPSVCQYFNICKIIKINVNSGIHFQLLYIHMYTLIRPINWGCVWWPWVPEYLSVPSVNCLLIYNLYSLGNKYSPVICRLNTLYLLQSWLDGWFLSMFLVSIDEFLQTCSLLITI